MLNFYQEEQHSNLLQEKKFSLMKEWRFLVGGLKTTIVQQHLLLSKPDMMKIGFKLNMENDILEANRRSIELYTSSGYYYIPLKECKVKFQHVHLVFDSFILFHIQQRLSFLNDLPKTLKTCSTAFSSMLISSFSIANLTWSLTTFAVGNTL